MIDEEIEELRIKDERGKKLAAMTQTEGWTDVLYPWIQRTMAGAIESVMKSGSYEAFIAHRQGYVTQEAILKYIDQVVAVGKAAHEKLHPSKGRSGDG